MKLLFENSKVHWDSNYQSGNPLGNVWAHSFTLSRIPGSVNVTLKPTPFHALVLVVNPRLRS